LVGYVKEKYNMPKLKLSPSAQREKNISDVLKKGMIEKGWSNQHLAILLNMCPGNLSKVINHPMTVKLETICLIADKLGVSELPTR
jgi:plasmid maintenance system antidote protein VapI